ncbi:plasminogen-like [Pecten maximus]|uniref:plasminogen-like n=1 Tax=Pecten maximus TaxID=6579 RepID=UPI0014581742|nr:plasminogen-like [Pecten maximus]
MILIISIMVSLVAYTQHIFISFIANDVFDINNLKNEGRVSCTVKGVKCQRWDSNTPHQPDYFSDRSDLHNWCQRTVSDVRHWCYTTDPKTNWDYCPVEERFVCEDSPPMMFISKTKVNLERPYDHFLSVGRYRCDTLEDKEPEESCPVTRCLSDGSWSIANISCSAQECYDPTDLTYNGRVTCTNTGFTCQRWGSEYPHHQAKGYGHSGLGNRCSMEDATKPWCFTMHPELQWEYCPVDKCT